MDESAKHQEDRRMLIQLVGELQRGEAMPALLRIVATSAHAKTRAAALQALGTFDGGETPEGLLEIWSSLTPVLREQALDVLSSRPPWAVRLLESVGNSGTISKADVSDLALMRLRMLRNADVDALVEQYFGKTSAVTSEEKAALIEQTAAILDRAKGKAAAGKRVFQERCAACHQLFGEGGSLGPDLTSLERHNRSNMLLQIIDPNAGIREGYTLFQLRVKDGRQLLGAIVENDGSTLTLRDVTGQLSSVPEDAILERNALPNSLMPERLFDGLSDAGLRDFFAYLESKNP